MWTWTGVRAAARIPSIVLAIAAGLPFGAALGRPNAIAAPSSSPPADIPEPFDLPRSDRRDSPYAAKWRGVAGAIHEDSVTLARCRTEPDGCPPAAQGFLAIVEAARAKEGRARLGEVNRALNLAIRYQSDIAQHGAADAWTSPLATLSSGRGDCEDYAIAKYLALREAGLSPDDLRLVVVRDGRLQQHHAILAARIEERWLVLDNRRLLLLEDREAGDYVAAIAFGTEAGSLPLLADGREGVQERAPPVGADAAPRTVNHD